MLQQSFSFLPPPANLLFCDPAAPPTHHIVDNALNANKLKGNRVALACKPAPWVGRRRRRERTATLRRSLDAGSGKSLASQFHDPHVKANLLLQSHFSRRPLSAELAGDLAALLPRAVLFLQAMVDVISSEGWLKPTLAAMELSQMVVQGLWADKDPLLLQVPHVTREKAAAFAALDPPVETVFDLAALDGAQRALVRGVQRSARGTH